MTSLNPRMTTLLFLLVNLNSLIGAFDRPVKAEVQLQLQQPNSDGYLELSHRDIDVFSLPSNSLKWLVLYKVKLTWDNTKRPVHLDNLKVLDMRWSTFNPHALTFSLSLTSLTLEDVEFINGTLVDLFKGITNLKYLEMRRMKEVDISKLFFPHFQIFDDKLVSLVLQGTEFINGTLLDVLNKVTGLQTLSLDGCGELDLFKLNFNQSTTNPFFTNLTHFTISKTKLIHGTLYDLLKNARKLEHLTIEDINELDISNSHELDDLFELNINQSTTNPVFANLTHFTISKIKRIQGTIYDILKNAGKLEHFKIKDIGELDIYNWSYNELVNSSTQFLSLGGNCINFHSENTRLINGSLNDLLKNAKKLQNLTIDGMGEVDLSTRSLSNFNTDVFGELTYLRIVNTTLIGTKTLQDILKGASKIEHLQIGQTHSDVDVSEFQNLQIWKRLRNLWIGKTHFVNGNLYDILKMTTNLERLGIDGMGKVDISQIYADKLEFLSLGGVTLARPHTSEERRFQNLHTLAIWRSEAEDSKPLFQNFQQMFPNIEEVYTDSKMIVHPKALLSMLNSSASYLQVSFDFDPPVKTYEFGEAIKKLISAGYTHPKYADNNKKKYSVYAVERVHLLTLGKVFSNGTVTEWSLYNDLTTVSYGAYSGTMDDIKPLETKVIIFFYFLFLFVFIGIGTIGNILSGIALFKTKIENSAGVILFALTFFDTGVILTYLGSSYFNAELFYRMFLMTGSKSTVYTVDEHLWLNEQHSVLAFFIYPLNKTAYSASVYTTVLISLERFIAVYWPLKAKYLLHRRNSIRAIVSILIFSVLLNFPRWIESSEWSTYSEDSPNWNDYYKPTLMRMESYRTIYHGWIWVTFMYVLPFILVAFFNFNIFRHTKLSIQLRRTLQPGTQEQSEEDTSMSPMTKMLLCVVAVFVFCNTIHIAIVFYFLATYVQIQLSTAEAVSCLPIVINCSVNFLIYVIFGKTLRAQFLILLPKCAKRICLPCCRKDMTTNS